MRPHTDNDGLPVREMAGIFRLTWLALLIAVSIFIRVDKADDYHYSPDEAMHVRMAEADSATQTLQFSLYETHPPLGNLLRYFWMKISDAPAFVRSQSLLFGVALILLYFQIGKQLHGELTGICCATMIAFSYGCIIQSYVVRHYILFVFFVSLGLYYYLRWRTTRKTSALLAYGSCCALASLIHFTGIFAIACFLLHESIEVLKRRALLRGDVEWLTVNLAVVFPVLAVYHEWQPIMDLAKPFFTNFVPTSPLVSLVISLTYPLSTFTYALPTYTAGVALVALLVVPAFRSRMSETGPNGFRSCLALTWIAQGLGMVLIVSGIYPFNGARHSLWTLPFIVPTLGWILADICTLIGSYLPQKLAGAWQYIAALLIFMGGWGTYDSRLRFHDNVEYAISSKQWEEAAPFLASLGPHDLVIGQKDDVIVLANLYPYMGDSAFTGTSMAALAPYGRAHILFNPFYRILLYRRTFLATLQEAERRGYFVGIDRLIFMKTVVTSPPISDLMRCSKLEQKRFIPSSYELMHAGNGFQFMTIPARLFFAEVLAPEGKAHACIAQ